MTFGAAYGALATTSRAGHTFAGWFNAASGGAEVTAATIVDTAANHTLYAHWTANELTLNYAAGTGGSLSGSTSQVVNYGGSGTAVTAVPNTNYHFVDWSDGSTANPRTDTNVTANVDVTANFAINTYTLNYAAGTGGTLTGDTAQVINHGENGTPVKAVPNTGYYFVDWSDGVTANPRTDTNITANINVAAHFAQITHNLTVAVDPTAGGTTSPAVGAHSYAEGAVVNLIATPASGYAFDHWSGACTGSGPCTVTMDADKTVTAHFAQITHDLTVAVDPTAGGTTSPAVGVHSYTEGAVVNLTAIPASGYTFDHWSGACTGSGPCAVTMDADKTVTAHFTPEEYSLIVTSAHGTVTKTPNQTTYHYGDAVTLTALAYTDWSFASWSGDITSSDNPVVITINGNTSVTANYTELPPNCYALYLSRSGQGSTPIANPAKSAACAATGQYVEGLSLIHISEPTRPY